MPAPRRRSSHHPTRTHHPASPPTPPPPPPSPDLKPPPPTVNRTPIHVPEPPWRRRHAPAPRASTALPRPTPPLATLYRQLRHHFGHQHWWPGETPFEVCVGAILTQNTAWTNVEKAIANLKAHGPFTPAHLAAIPAQDLARLLRPTGYFNVKTRRLQTFLRFLTESCQGNLSRLFAGSTPAARARLLALPGIGPETADSMLLYAGNHPTFVIDAYTRRVLLRHGWCAVDDTYDDLQRLWSGHPRPPGGQTLLDYWQDAHAQFVAVGKEFCRPRTARCGHCPLANLLPPQPAIPKPQSASPSPGLPCRPDPC